MSCGKGQQMNQDFNQCLENKKSIAFPRGKELVNKELSIAQGEGNHLQQAGFPTANQSAEKCSDSQLPQACSVSL